MAAKSIYNWRSDPCPESVFSPGTLLRKTKKAIAILQEVINMTPSLVEPVSDWEQIKKARVLQQKYQ